MHRDINFESFWIGGKKGERNLKLVNFGLAEMCKRGEQLSEEVGQLHYRAPEVT